MSVQELGQFGDFALTVVVTSPPWFENCYLVRHVPTGELVVVDPGGDALHILETIKAGGGTAKAVWLTHGHPDHLGAARAMEDALDIPTLAHIDESTVIARASELNRTFTGRDQEGPGRLQTFDGEPTFTLGGQTVRVIHTPGHTPGGVCFDFGGFTLTGDTLFRQGFGRTDLPGGDEKALWRSISRFLEMTQDDNVLFAGHGPGWTAGDAKRWWRLMQ